jgi:hypothetical protein
MAALPRLLARSRNRGRPLPVRLRRRNASIMLCILYVNAVGMLLAVAGILVERVLPATFPRRWLWFAVIPISMILPGYYRGHHMVSVLDVQQAVQPPLGQAFGTAYLTALDPSWWARIESYDTSINRVWITVSAVLVLWGLANAWRVSRLVSLSRGERGDAGGASIVDGFPVVVTDSIGPAAVGARPAATAAPICPPSRGGASEVTRRAPSFRSLAPADPDAVESCHVVAGSAAVPRGRDGLRQPGSIRTGRRGCVRRAAAQGRAGLEQRSASSTGASRRGGDVGAPANGTPRADAAPAGSAIPVAGPGAWSTRHRVVDAAPGTHAWIPRNDIEHNNGSPELHFARTSEVTFLPR